MLLNKYKKKEYNNNIMKTTFAVTFQNMQL